MDAATLTEPQPTGLARRRWGLATRIAFRFCVVYFGLFCIATQILTTLISPPNVDIPDPTAYWPMRPIIFWTAAHIFQIKTPLIDTETGSGDRTVDWVLAFCLLVFALAITAIWSALDRRRENYATLRKWFWLFLRIALAGQMVTYGMDKAVPLQMPFPYLVKLIEPFGNQSPMGVLWASIGASPAYEIFAGCAELAGAILLVFPRTVTLGALICLTDMIQVFMLNMSYDVPVKLFSFHLILISVLLLAPEYRRLANVFLLNRPAEPSIPTPFFRTERTNRIAAYALSLLWVWIFAVAIYVAWSGWRNYGGGRQKSALYGIWDVEEFTVDGQSRPPLLTDSGRWRRAVFDFPESMSFHRMDDSRVRYDASIDIRSKTLALTNSSDENAKANFTYERPVPDQLVLDGQMEGHNVHMLLHLMDNKKFLVVSRGFHWIQENPFNR
jgi:uncharacterized membrane protein YphA (DoxX/SURF4 family)